MLTAKVLAKCLQPILFNYIRSTQIGSVKDRYILGNILLTQKSIHWTQKTNHNLVILLFDLKKAYDYVN